MKRNTIKRLLVNGTWVEDAVKVKSEVFEHFKRQFTETSRIRPSFNNNNFLHLHENQITFLESPFSCEEIKATVWACEGTKAPGPDGFTFSFVKTHWEILKVDIVNFMQDFHQIGQLARGCNSTFVTLIPKVKGPLTLADYRPISLVGCHYKLLAKVLDERLKRVLPSVISDSQSAFISGRQILDGILIANEVVHWSNKNKQRLLLFKADFAKAFDYLN